VSLKTGQDQKKSLSRFLIKASKFPVIPKKLGLYNVYFIGLLQASSI